MRRTSLVVCALLLAGCGRQGSSTTSAPAPTFNKDVAPILFEHCVTCHRPEQGAPFTLLSYADAAPRAKAIARMVQSRRMPPWLPDPVEPAFAGERRLSAGQIDTIRRWVETGAAEGDARDLPPTLHLDNTWSLGTPDLVLTPAKPYVLSPGETDVFRNLVIRTKLTADRAIRAVEFRPGTAPVHHAVIHLDRTASSRQRDGADGRPGFDGMGGGDVQEPEGHFVGWAPGRGPILSAAGMPWRLAQGTDLVVELHLIPGARPVDVQPTVALFFAPTPGTTTPLTFKMGFLAIDIPAGAREYAIDDRYVLPVDVDLLSLYPHAHYLGRDMLVTATAPDGSVRRLLHIPQWSFHWQQDYRFTAPVPLARGTTISMVFTYDNSDGNPENPHHPPIAVQVGQRSTDEMGNLLLQVVPHVASDRARLMQGFALHASEMNVIGHEMLVKRDPGNAEYHTQLGASYVDVGRIAEGMASLERALQLDPRSSRAHNEMGGALLRANRPADAVAEFRQAAALAPRDAKLQYNFGKALQAARLDAEAGAAFERAVALDPGLAEAHDELGAWLFARGRLREALAHLQRAVDLAPDSAIAHSDLGGALAQAGRIADAMAHIRRALELDPENAAAKENLARLMKRR